MLGSDHLERSANQCPPGFEGLGPRGVGRLEIPGGRLPVYKSKICDGAKDEPRYATCRCSCLICQAVVHGRLVPQHVYKLWGGSALA